MSEGGDNSLPSGAAGPVGPSAGAMLRAARDKRGLHIAALAASIKVSPRKLEALEADRYDELPDITFTRALAQTVCRTLKVDAEPVLAQLPQAGDMPRLAKVGGGINAPFRAASSARDPSELPFLRSPVFWVTLAVLVGAVVLALLPERWMPWHGRSSAPVVSARPTAASITPTTTTAPLANVPAPDSAAAVPVVDSGAATPTAPASAVVDAIRGAAQSSLGVVDPATPTTGILTVRTNAESWVEVQDSRGQMLLSRAVQPGETVGVDGALPLRLTVGNATATQLTFRGQAVDLAPSTRDNVARLQLPPR